MHGFVLIDRERGSGFPFGDRFAFVVRRSCFLTFRRLCELAGRGAGWTAGRGDAAWGWGSGLWGVRRGRRETE